MADKQTKASPEDVDSPPTQEEVMRWVREKGNPFELAIGREFRGNGWETRHGYYYEDPIEKKPRELDILAWKMARRTVSPDTVDTPAIGFTLAVQCKRSETNPWIVFSSDSTESHSLSVVNELPGTMGPQLIRWLGQEGKGDRLQKFGSVHYGRRYGHGITQYRRSKNVVDPAYNALVSAANAASAVAATQESVGGQVGSTLDAIVRIVLPVVVFGGTLYELYLADAGHEVLHEVAWLKVMTPDPLRPGSVVRVTVITPAALPTFLQQVDSDLNTLEMELFPSLKRLIDRDREKITREIAWRYRF